MRGAVADSKPLAYTTVMTLLERLARKNAVSRRKVGRAFVYTPSMTRDAMRRLALKEFVDCYFDGSNEKLAEFLKLPAWQGPPEKAELQSEPDPGMEAALL